MGRTVRKAARWGGTGIVAAFRMTRQRKRRRDVEEQRLRELRCSRRRYGGAHGLFRWSWEVKKMPRDARATLVRG